MYFSFLLIDVVYPYSLIHNTWQNNIMLSWSLTLRIESLCPKDWAGLRTVPVPLLRNLTHRYTSTYVACPRDCSWSGLPPHDLINQSKERGNDISHDQDLGCLNKPTSPLPHPRGPVQYVYTRPYREDLKSIAILKDKTSYLCIARMTGRTRPRALIWSVYIYENSWYFN